MSSHHVFTFLQRTFPLFQDRSVWLEKLCSSQFESQQMLREDRESCGDREPKEGMPVGHEPEQNHEDGRGDRKVVQKGPDRDQKGNADAR